MLDRRFNHVIAVAHYGSFTRAAEQTGITQSGITKSIADLEQELGYPLFYRTSKGAVQTEAGRDFVDRAVRLLEDARALLTSDRERNDPFAVTLRIGVCPASLEWFLADPLAALLKRHPSIRFEVIASTFERIIHLLRTGAVDVAVGFEDAFDEWGEVKQERIAELEVTPFVRKAHPILGNPGPTHDDMARFDFVTASDSRPYGSIIRNIFENAGVGPWQRHVHVIDYFPIVKRIVATSNAIGVTTVAYSRSQSFQASYAVVPGDSPFPPAPICCATLSRWDPTPPVRSFLSVMRERLPS